MKTNLLEIGASSSDFVNQVLDTKDIEFAERFFDDGVVCKWDALLVDLAISAFVDEFAYTFQVGLAGVAVSNMTL